MAIVPDPNDLALAKLCAWRDKDVAWIVAGVRAGVFSVDEMHSRLADLPERAPAIEALESRFRVLDALMRR